MRNELWQCGQTDVSAIDWTIFCTRLGRAIAWCERRDQVEELATFLRITESEPPHLRLGRDDEVCWVGRERDRQLGWPSDSTNRLPDLRGGRLLAYFPDADLCDGAAEAESQGFFNVYNMPAWDTWFAYFEDPTENDRSYSSYVVAYIPRVVVPVAQSGIIVNPEECIAWLSDTNTLLSRALKSIDTEMSHW